MINNCSLLCSINAPDCTTRITQLRESLGKGGHGLITGEEHIELAFHLIRARTRIIRQRLVTRGMQYADHSVQIRCRGMPLRGQREHLVLIALGPRPTRNITEPFQTRWDLDTHRSEPPTPNPPNHHRPEHRHHPAHPPHRHPIGIIPTTHTNNQHQPRTQDHRPRTTQAPHPPHSGPAPHTSGR